MKIRQASNIDIPEIARVHVDTWKTTYKNVFSDDYLAKMSYEKREQIWHQVFSNSSKDNNFTYVAENEFNQIIGFANAGIERENNLTYHGELYAIYILKDCQRKGLGTKLFESVVDRLQTMQINSMLVWVLNDNSACRFYQKLGGIKVYSKDIERQETKLLEVAYGWEDISIIRK